MIKMPSRLREMVMNRASTALPRLTSVITIPEEIVGGTAEIMMNPMAREDEKSTSLISKKPRRGARNSEIPAAVRTILNSCLSSGKAFVPV